MLDNLTLINVFMVVVITLLIITYRYSFRKTRWLWPIFIITFLATSTKILPAKLVASYEAKTPILNRARLDNNQLYYIHVLGSGYSLDANLPATSQLNTTTLARLVEGIRISRFLPHYKIVTSGDSRLGLESQASVARRAAVELGIPFENCEILTTPSTTAEEASAFVSKFGTNKKVIVVSTAIHLPRALMLYKEAGIDAIGAPTSFKVKNGVNDNNGLHFPSIKSIDLMSEYLRERLKYWKDTKD